MRSSDRPRTFGGDAKENTVKSTAIATVSAIGSLIVVLAYHAARLGVTEAEILYWFGLVIVFAPIALAALDPSLSTGHRLSLTLLLGLCLYVVRYAYQPLVFAFQDEQQHLRTLTDIVRSHELFHRNPALPISPSFPGLEILAASISAVTGASLHLAGILVAAISKLLTVAALFWLFERGSGSSQVAMLAATVYMSNPHFIHFGSMFAYGTLALPLLVLALVMTDTWISSKRASAARSLAVVAALAALTVTHHLTSFVAMAMFVLWSILALATWIPAVVRIRLLLVTVFFGAAVATWHMVSGANTGQYFAIILNDAMDALSGAVGVSPSPPLDRPLWELAVGGLALCVVALGIPLGIWRLWSLRPEGLLSRLLLVLSCAFYVSVVARFLPKGDELAGRMWNFSYIGIAFALGGVLATLASRNAAARTIGVATLLLLFIGGVSLGYPAYWARLPGSFLVAGFERSVDQRGVAAAHWQDEHLPDDARLATDFTGQVLAGGYGRLDPVRDAYLVFFGRDLGPGHVSLLTQNGVEYLQVDNRLCTDTPQTGFYFMSEEEEAFAYEEPIPCGALRKFDDSDYLVRIFDDGEIRIFRFIPDHSTDEQPLGSGGS